MPWTAPRIWTTTELITAAIMNTDQRDNMLQTAPALVTTAGDLVQATAANALARLGIGTAAQFLRVNAGATAVEWAGLTGEVKGATADLSLTASFASVVGASRTLAVAGLYILFGFWDFDATADDNVRLLGVIEAGGADQAGEAGIDTNTDDPRQSASIAVQYTAAASDVVRIRARKTAGSGTSKVRATHSRIAYIGP